MHLTKYDVNILAALFAYKALNRKEAKTLKEVEEKLKQNNKEISIFKIRSAMTKFILMELVEEGAKVGERANAKTYYLSHKGLEVLEDKRKN